MIDTTMSVEPYVSTLLSSFDKTIEIAFTDKDRYKGLGATAALMLTGYWNNVRSSRDSAYLYLLKGLDLDSTHPQLKSIKETFDKQKSTGGGQRPGSRPVGNKPSAAIIKQSNKS
jgi:hypothetical protein